ncbi:hypothetical protein HS125_12000 [bacterium]|nr:hypothetical protein [bacterium]
MILVGAVRLTWRNGRATALLLWPAACYLAGSPWCAREPRFLLPLIICLLAPVAMAAFLPRQGGRARDVALSRAAGAVAGASGFGRPIPRRAARAEKAIPAVAATLAEHGVETARVVVSSDPGFYFVEGGRLAAYRPLHPSGEAPPASPDEAAAWLERQGARFLVLESMNVPALAPGLACFSPAPSRPDSSFSCAVPRPSSARYSS